MASQNLGLQTQTGLAGSPASGAESPSSPGGEKIGRAQAKKIFKDEVDQLVRAVKLIPVYADLLAGAKRSEKVPITFTDTNGQPRQYQIGRSEYKEFISQTVRRMQALPTLAFTLNKTRRRTAPNSGFLAPAQFSAEIVNFFAGATIGPIVTGNFVMKTDKAKNRKMVPESKSLRVQQGTRLNNVLYFTQQQLNGQQNPLYGIISPGTLTPLFALHAYYSQMQNPNDATRLSASNEMRQALGNVMRQTIETDVRTLSTPEKYGNNPALVQQIQQVGQQLIAAIQNPQAEVNSRFPTGQRKPNGDEEFEEIFNPNYFLYAHFSKLISNGKVTFQASPEFPTWESYLNRVRQSIPTVYSQNVAGLTGASFQAVQSSAQQGQVPAYENVVLQAQQNFVALARAYKNQIQQAEQRRRRAAEKASKIAQQQAQVAAQAQAGLAGVGGLGGLPGSNLTMPTVAPIVGLPGLPGGANVTL